MAVKILDDRDKTDIEDKINKEKSAIATALEDIRYLQNSYICQEFVDKTIVDINYGARNYQDSKGVLTFARENVRITYRTAASMNAYGVSTPALNVSIVGQTMKYTGSVILGTRFAIELYGVFTGGEILNDGGYNIEVIDDPEAGMYCGFGAWYLPLGGAFYITTDTKYRRAEAHHIVIVGNVDKFSLYVDGELAAEASYTIPDGVDMSSDDNDIYPGGKTVGNALYLMRFRVFDTAPNADEVKALYELHRPLSLTNTDVADKLTAIAEGMESVYDAE